MADLYTDARRQACPSGENAPQHYQRQGGIHLERTEPLRSYDTSILKEEAELEALEPEELMAELRKTRQLCFCLDEIIENLSDTIYVTDGSARTMRVNKAYEQLSGLSRKEIIGLNMKEMEARYISKSGTLVVLETGREANLELSFNRTGRHAFICSKPIYDADGKIKMVVSNSRNFEEIQNLEERLSKAETLADRYRDEIRALKEQILPKSDIIAEDKKMLDVLSRAHKVAKVDSTTLILGETGVGKEEVAKYIHQHSSRAKHRFVKINCGALTESLIESELFGYEKGAFTGANKNGKMGLFEVANGGTLFLDEIGELPLSMQVKLLRVLQDQQVQRIGGTDTIHVDVRILAATNRDLKEMVRQKQFREDLYYRFNVVPIQIPPLRERPNDIIPLASRFLDDLNKRYGFQKHLSNLAFQFLKEYPWPGNVRELKNIIEQAVIMSEGDLITVDDLPLIGYDKTKAFQPEEEVDLREVLEQIECEYINRAYEHHKSVRQAAKSLNMNYSTFERKRMYYISKYPRIL